MGRLIAVTNAGRMVMQPTQSFRSAVRILVSRKLAAPYLPPTKRFAVSCITVRPLLALK